MLPVWLSKSFALAWRQASLLVEMVLVKSGIDARQLEAATAIRLRYGGTSGNHEGRREGIDS